MVRGRALFSLILLVPAFSGCFDGESLLTSEKLLEVDLGPLAAGESARYNFSVEARHGYLFVGGRTGSADTFHGFHVVLRAPNGTDYDSERLAPSPALCVVSGPAPGRWALDVAVDRPSGRLGVSRFTIRAGAGPPPSVFACRDEPFPGAGIPLTVFVAENLTANGTEPLTRSFVMTKTNGTLDAQLLAGSMANATLRLTPPGGIPVAPPFANATAGDWRVSIHAENATAGFEVVNATIVVTFKR